MASGFVDGLQASLTASGASWTASENEITALPPEEQDLLLGYKPDPASGEMPLEIRESFAALTARQEQAAFTAFGAPASYDLRNVGGRNFVTGVRNQQSCGSCVSFGSIAAVEATTRLARNDPSFAIDLSEGHLFNCIARSQGRDCNTGWWVDPAMRALRDVGVVDEACSPYSPANTQCTLCADWQSRTVRIASYKEVRAVSEMKEWLSTKGATAACFTVYDDFMAYGSGVYRKTSNVLRGGHCVCVVGYDDAQRAWICKNSWGTGWGQGGFFLIGYGECGIDASMWGVTVGAAPRPHHAHFPLYRYWNPGNGDHFYTTNWGELGGGKYGWGYEGIQCHVAPGQLPGTVPLHRYWNAGIGDHFYTTNWAELGAGAYGWGYEGVQCYVWQARSGQVAEDIPSTFQLSADPPGGLAGGPSAGPSLVGPGSAFGEAPALAGMTDSFSTVAGAMSGVPSSFRTEVGGGEEGMKPSSFAATGGKKCGCGCGAGRK